MDKALELTLFFPKSYAALPPPFPIKWFLVKLKLTEGKKKIYHRLINNVTHPLQCMSKRCKTSGMSVLFFFSLFFGGWGFNKRTPLEKITITCNRTWNQTLLAINHPGAVAILQAVSDRFWELYRNHWDKMCLGWLLTGTDHVQSGLLGWGGLVFIFIHTHIYTHTDVCSHIHIYIGVFLYIHETTAKLIY